MSGKIELSARPALTLKQKKGYIKKEGDAVYYPEAYLIVTEEDKEKKKIKFSPTYNDICKMLEDFRKHELKVDSNMNRKQYTSTLIRRMKELVKKLEQLKLNELETPEEIYTKQYDFKSFKEAKEYFRK